MTYALVDAAMSLAPIAVLIAAPEALVVNTLTTAVVVAKDYYEARTGTNLFTGETLSSSEQAMSALSASLSGIMPALAVVKSAQKFTASVRALGEIFAGERADIAAMNAVQKAKKIVDSAENSLPFHKT